PLYYHLKNGALYWGSEIKALLAHPIVPRQFNNQAIVHQLMHTMVPGTTLFDGIYALKPGHMLIVRRTEHAFEVVDRKYWDIDYPRAKDRDLSISPEDHIRKTQEQLLEAVAYRLEADVPVGCYLSGGIDSCS